MIVGDVQATGGEITKSKETTIGFLNQDLLSYQSDEPILEVAMMAFQEAHDLQHEMDLVIKKMETDYEDSLVDKLAKIQERFEAIDGYSIQSRAEEVLEGIGFNTEDLQRPLREFSGGWRMRVMLAKLLLEQPSLLMLDEPTNHLDLPSIEWLENYIQTYDGACIIVSHDRRFLNASVNKIVEVFNYDLHVYNGNYDFYESEKELRNEIQQNAYENQQKQIKQTERFIERFKAKATKAKQAQSRIKQLERMDKIDAVVDTTAKVDFQFNFKTRSGKKVVTLDSISKSYEDLEILKNTSGLVERGDKIAFIGANGKGKSTALRIIAGTEPHEGNVELGHNVITAFYAQHQLEALDVENEILDELKQAGTGKTDQELRGVLGCFLFSDDEVFKKIKVLSGGEKSRVALAKTLISEANFLMLDEPTNHLDMMSVNILVQALNQYEGTFILVSHDRDFITRVANKIWYIDKKELKEYPGTYEEFAWWWSKEQEKRKQNGSSGSGKSAAAKKKKDPAKKSRSSDDDEKKNLHQRISLLEKEIETVEMQIKDTEKLLADPDIYENSEKLDQTNNTYEQLKSRLDRYSAEWEQLVDQIS